MIKCLHTFDNDQAFIPWMSVRQGITGLLRSICKPVEEFLKGLYYIIVS